MSRHRKTSMIPIALTLSLLLAAPIVASAQSTTLIPRQAIFGNPERAGAQVSPDGKFVSFLAPRDGVMNVWVVERGKPFTAAKPMTSEKVRPIRAYSWMANGEDIVYAQDKGGDENFLMYAVNVNSSKERTLTDFKGVRVRQYGSSLKRPDELVVGINDRDKRFHDPYLLNVKTGTLKKLFDNTAQYSGFLVDDALDIRFATKSTPDGGWEMFQLEGGRATAFDKVGFFRRPPPRKASRGTERHSTGVRAGAVTPLRSLLLTSKRAPSAPSARTLALISVGPSSIPAPAAFWPTPSITLRTNGAPSTDR